MDRRTDGSLITTEKTADRCFGSRFIFVHAMGILVKIRLILKKCGQFSDPLPGEGADGEYRVYGPGGAFLALSRLEQGRLVTIKSFFEV